VALPALPVNSFSDYYLIVTIDFIVPSGQTGTTPALSSFGIPDQVHGLRALSAKSHKAGLCKNTENTFKIKRSSM
jgi:hypothetical protein